MQPTVVPDAGHGGSCADQRLQMRGRATSGLSADTLPGACGMALGGAEEQSLSRGPVPKPAGAGSAVPARPRTVRSGRPQAALIPISTDPRACERARQRRGRCWPRSSAWTSYSVGSSMTRCTTRAAESGNDGNDNGAQGRRRAGLLRAGLSARRWRQPVPARARLPAWAGSAPGCPVRPAGSGCGAAAHPAGCWCSARRC